MDPFRFGAEIHNPKKILKIAISAEIRPAEFRPKSRFWDFSKIMDFDTKSEWTHKIPYKDPL